MSLTIWMMSINEHFKSLKVEGTVTMVNHATHSLKHVSKGGSFGFSTLRLSNNTIAFLPSKCYKCATPLGLGNNCYIQSLV